MQRKHQLIGIYSGFKTLKSCPSSKEALNTSSNQLKQMLGPKLQKIKKSQNKYQQHRIKVIQSKNVEMFNKQTHETSTFQNPTETEPNQNDKNQHNTLKIQRFSHRFLATTSTRRNNNDYTLDRINRKNSGSSSMNKYASVRHGDSSIPPKSLGITNLQMNAMKRRCKNMISQSSLSKSMKTEFKKEEHKIYYIKDVKNSVSEFKNNEEYMDGHLTHFMESISAFKMFGCSYLPEKPHRIVNLPEISKDKITLVFDMDETLIHSQVLHSQLTPEDIGWGKTVDIVTDDGKYQVNLKIRPHAAQVLQRLSQFFEIGVLTAGQEHYANKLLNELDPDNKLFSFRLFRPHCLEMYSRVPYVKDLRVLGNRDMSRVVLIDNSPHSYMFQKRNGIPVVSFYEDEQDNELLKLENFLMGLLKVKDVRKYLHEYFRFEQFNRFGCMNKLIQQLY